MSEHIIDVSEQTHNYSPARLKLITFLCGASLMGLEMAGVRILEPYFGSTIYVWGSIIGIFLGALSIGYWLGGILADKSPRLSVLGGIVLAAAIMTFLIPPLSKPLCSLLSDSPLGPRLRALIGSVGLYMIPSILMGMVSPFVVRLAAHSIKGVGSVAGSLYAVGTVGSLVGTFLVSFVLTELIGSKLTVYAVGGMLMLVSVICFSGKLRAPSIVGLVLAVLVAGAGWKSIGDPGVFLMNPDVGGGKSKDGFPADEILESRESAYHKITIVRGRSLIPGEDKDLSRLMMFNNQIESGIKLGIDGKVIEPVESACGYTRMLHLGLLFTGVKPRRILIIGCGGGIGPQVFASDYKDTVERIDVVDIDRMVFEMAEEHFQYPFSGGSDVIRSHVADGRLFLHNAKEKWDYIILDAYTSGGRIPRHLISKEFFELAKAKLEPGGVLVANVISSSASDKPESRLYRACWKTMETVFPDNVYALPRHNNDERGTNIILIGADLPQRLNSYELSVRLSKMRLNDVIKRKDLDSVVRGAVVSSATLNLKGVPVLTDDFCPTDSMVHN